MDVSVAALSFTSILLLSGLSRLSFGEPVVTSQISLVNLNEQFTFSCSVSKSTSDEILRPKLQIFRTNEEIVLTQLLKTDLTIESNATFGSNLQDRNLLSFDDAGQTFTLTKSKADCSDDAVEYKCVLIFLNQGEALETSKEDHKTVYVRAKPEMPTSFDQTKTSLEEGEDIDFNCVGNVGRPDKGNIRWRISSPGMTPEIPPLGDSRVTERPSGGTQSCTQVQRSKLTLANVNRAYQNITASCFVTNQDFKPDIPQHCRDPATDLCQESSPVLVYYPVTSVKVTMNTPGVPYETGSVTMVCSSDSFPPPVFTWVKTDDENRTLAAEVVGGESRLTLTNLNLTADAGQYNCTASNSYNSKDFSVISYMVLTISPTTTTQSTTTVVTTPPPPTVTPDRSVDNSGGDDDESTIIIAVCVTLAVLLIIALIVGFYVYKKRRPKSVIEEPSEKPYKHNLSFQNPQPDLVADEKKFNNPSLNSSFQNEDGLMYADLTYDNRPRSRKPMAIGDTASEYSDVQMPSV